MEKFIRIIIPDCNITNECLMGLPNTVKNVLTESKNHTKVGILDTDEIVIYINLSKHLSEAEADQYAYDITKYLNENELVEFDIEMSTGIPLTEEDTISEPVEEKPLKVDLFSKTDYDVVNDLVVFMRNDYEFYHRYYFPALFKATKYYQKTGRLDLKKFIDPVIQYGAKEYCKKYDTVETPEKLFPKQVRSEVLDRIVKDETNDIKSGN